MRFILTNLRLVLLLSCFGFACEILAQSHYVHHAKYWYYRTRLRNDFLLVGAGQGMSIPMQQRGYLYYPYQTSPVNYNFTSNPNGALGVDGTMAKWGDAMSDLGYYIAVLATEYKLLAINNQATDSALKELFYAIYAVNRLDKNGEILWNRLVSNGVQSNSAKCTTSGGCLDGFMARDDVDFDFVPNNYDHFNYFGNHGFCSKVKVNTEIDGGGSHQTSWSSAYYETGPSYQGSFISQDNYINVLVGLALVRKLIPDGVGYLNKQFQDGEYYMYREAQRIIDRVLVWFDDTDAYGFMYYADKQTHIASGNGGYVGPYSYAQNEAENKIVNNRWDNYNPTEITGNRAFHDACDRHQYLHVNTGHPIKDAITNAWRNSIGIAARWTNYYVFSNHSVSGASNADEGIWKTSLNFGQGNTPHTDAAVMTTNLMAVCNCIYDFVSNRTGTQMFGPEYSTFDFHINASTTAVVSRDLFHGKLIKAILYGSENCGYGEDNPFPWNELSSSYSLLTTAPCEGTFSYPTGYGPYAPYEWNTTSRLDHPQRREDRLTGSSYDGNVYFPGEYNGLDYMLYHNLHYLVRNQVTPDNENKLVDFSNRILTLSYPLSSPNTSASNPWGSASNPATVSAYEVIDANCVVNSNAVVSMRAGKEVQLGNGFSAVLGSQWSATIQQLVCTDIFNQNNNYDNINGRTVDSGSGSNNQTPFEGLPTSYDSAYKGNLTSQIANLSTNGSSFTEAKNNTLPFFTKVDKINLDNSVSVFPNPTDGLITISFQQPRQVKDFEIESSLGESIYSSTLSFEKENRVNISECKAGIYILKITDTNNRVWYKKLVKN